MPGKVNPVIPEVVTQVAAQVIGNDAAIAIGGMQGHFELNVFVPLMARNLLDSIDLLASASRLLAERCVDGIEANREQCERYAELTLSAATALNPFIGYDRAGEIVKKAAASGRSLREVALEAGRRGVGARRGARLPQDGEAARVTRLGGARRSADRASRIRRPVVAAAPQLQRRSRSKEALAASAVTLLLALSASVIPIAGASSGTPGNDAKGAHAVKQRGAADGSASAPLRLDQRERRALGRRDASRRSCTALPSDSAPVVTRLETTTTDQTTNVVLVLGGIELKGDQTWYRVRLPILPNNSTGWVRKSALGDLYTVDTHLYINRATLTATLKRDGKVVFKTHRRRRHAEPSHAARAVLRPRQAGRLRQPGVRPARVRDERSLADADRLAGRRLHRRPRHERAVDPARLRLARLHPHAERVDPEAVAADARRHADHDRLSAGAARASAGRFTGGTPASQSVPARFTTSLTRGRRSAVSCPPSRCDLRRSFLGGGR